ncbi:MAG TPA: enoyl-CoA hydratase-related protein, partial [Candidatus Thermoplasmatota archaeon]|nr:enoyl-CoA hydratase-related protein [Candidatus Thermoplasmatota archaeon]
AFATAGYRTLVHDVSEDAIARGLQRVRGPLEKRVADGKMPKAEAESILANLHAAPDFAQAAGEADLAVEAVFEDLKVKQDLFRRLDAACPPHTVLATNTSSLYVKDLAAATKRPHLVVGLHFFFPAAINKLVEVVRGPATSADAFQAAYGAVKRSGKVPIETADAPGFAVNRFFVPWVNEACRLLEEGVADIPTIEAAAKECFGVTMGPFELMNVTGVPISLHAQTTLHRELGAFYEPARVLREQVALRKDWDLSGTPDPSRKNAVAARLRGVAFGIACHLVDEGVATVRDTDRGATIGLRWANGPFAMMNRLGAGRALADVQALHARWGDAFPLPQRLQQLAAAGAAWPIPAVTWEAIEGGQVALVTFDRPEALNALNESVLRDLDHVLAEVERARPRAVVLTGEGKAFIAGADIPTMKALGVAGAKAYTELGNRVLDRLASLPCPVLVAINGFAFGGGLELALCGDLLYASDKAQLGLPEVGLGIHPGFGGTQRLPRRIGPGAAKDLIYTGRTLGAQDAKAIGLVNDVFPAAELLERVLAIARGIAEKAPLAVTGAKQSIDQGLGMDLRAGLQVEQDSVVLLFASEDKDEGLQAFLERRKPRFQGR